MKKWIGNLYLALWTKVDIHEWGLGANGWISHYRPKTFGDLNIRLLCLYLEVCIGWSPGGERA